MGLLCLALFVCGIARAGDDALQMVGQARLEVLWWPVYDSRLFTPGGAYTEGTRPLRLEIQYLRDIRREDLVENTRKEWQRLGVVGAQAQQWLDTVARLWPDVRKNDVLALALDNQDRTTFLLNGEVLGAIDDPGFGRDFLAIWLSPETSRPELRLALLGQQ
ncbi:MAG: chalcone isomerase family protein [Halieaceae bacterium]|jgi:hypothetical protein|nr:chalcone isomerase family protein [Halieaceae bacterium]